VLSFEKVLHDRESGWYKYWYSIIYFMRSSCHRRSDAAGIKLLLKRTLVHQLFIFSGVDVCQSVYSLLTSLGGAAYLSSLQKFALLIAALMHDLDHPG
jgi:hypothetical protein